MGQSDERLGAGRHDDGKFRLSFSKADKAQTCLHSYDMRYNQRIKGEQGMFAGVGKAAHGVPEDLLNEHIDAKRRAPLDRDRVAPLLRARWIQEKLPGGESEFSDALSWLSAWASEEGVVDYREIIGVEVPFSIELAPDILLEGVIDRIDRIGNTAIVIDYKTNRRLYSQHDLDNGLQLTIYELAVREMYQWVEAVELRYVMLRHGITQLTSRSPERVGAVRHYLLAIAEMLQALEEFPPSPHPLCAYCPYFDECPAHADHEGPTPSPAEIFAEWAREYAFAEALEKTGKRRRYDAQRALSALMKHLDGPQSGAGYTFDTMDIFRRDQSPREVCERIAEVAAEEIRPIDVAELLCKINNKALEDVLEHESLKLTRSDKLVLAAEVEAMGTFKPSGFFIAKQTKRP